MGEIIGYKEVEEKIISVRGQDVLLDSSVAELYGVETKRINEAVKNNPEKFPEGYIITLTAQEKNEVVENFDHLEKVKFSPALPSAFTEKGLYMLATILKSSRATQTTIAIIEAFTKIRELSRIINQLSETQENAQQKALMQKSGEILAELIGPEVSRSDDEALEVDGDETTIELNLAFVKFKRTVKRSKKRSDG